METPLELLDPPVPKLAEWLAEDPANYATMSNYLQDLFSWNEDAVVGKTLGFTLACFWRETFEAAQVRLPFCYLVGLAGSGKTSIMHHMLRWHTRDRVPASSIRSLGILPITQLDSFLSWSGHRQDSRMIGLDEYRHHAHDGTKSVMSEHILDLLRFGTPEKAGAVVLISETPDISLTELHQAVAVPLRTLRTEIGVTWATRFRHLEQSENLLEMLSAYMAEYAVSEMSTNRLKAALCSDWRGMDIVRFALTELAEALKPFFGSSFDQRLTELAAASQEYFTAT